MKQKENPSGKKWDLVAFVKRAAASCIAAAMCVTSLPATGLATVEAATPAERPDPSIVYYVDCGDFVVNTAGDGEQFGTHNSVTDQAYGEDPETGYQWGIIDQAEEYTGNNVSNGEPPNNGGVYTANTWAFEHLATPNIDYPKTTTNRYSKNFTEKGIEERFIDYAFELEEGSYEVTVGCVNPWSCSNSPVVKAILETANSETVLSPEDFTVPLPKDGGSAEVEGTVAVPAGGDKLTVDVRGTGNQNACVNVGYILIKSIKTGETEDEKNIRKDLEALKLPESTKEDLALPGTGENGSIISWKSSNEAVISNDGKVTRPEAGKEDATVTLEATASFGSAEPQKKEFNVKVPAIKVPTPIDREDNYVVYFVDCGDYVVNTVGAGDQFGTHNSVTDQAYGEDPETAYKWGIVDVDYEYEGNNKTNPAVPNNGGVYTKNTWAFETLTANQDHDKTTTNRYTKNFWEKGIEERILDYKFELENGKYDVYVCCVDPWNCSKSPNVYLNYGKDTQKTLKEGLDATSKEVGKKTVDVTDGELTVNLKATGDDNKAINLAYILIRKYKELTPEEMEADAKNRVTNDHAALTLETTNITSDITLKTEGDNETTITWKSSNEAVLSSTGKVTRPAAGNADALVTLTATISYKNGEYQFSMDKNFDVKVLAESDMQDLQEFALADVEITEAYYNNVADKDVEFLNKFDPDRLLYNFRLTAGYNASEIQQFDVHNNGTGASSPYPGGWENSRIGGHTLGHYLAAAAQAIANGYGQEKGTDGLTLEQRLNYLIDELKVCQDKLGTGYIFGATLASQSDPERQFNILETGSTNDTWVPWYTMHKIVNGLIETYKLTGNKTALTVVENLGEWTYNRTSKWNADIQRKVLGVEYGGMNDCLYEVYKYAKKNGYANADHFKTAAHWFDEVDLFENILAGKKNHLNGRHANCTIPKFMGALNRYRALKDEGDELKYLQYAEAFWTLITEKHTYITGGNSECEFFGADNVLDAERSHCNCETCNTHNMLKLTRELYRITGDKKYADYYETTFINAIMASVDEKTGMTTYFQPMATGFFKVYCNPDLEKNYFWCCTGTGLENFTKLGDSFYYYVDNKLIVNQYTSSNVTWKDKNVVLKQETDIPNTDQAKFTVELQGGKTSEAFVLCLRIPDWIKGEAVVKVNGTVQNNTVSNGYIALDRTWNNGDTVEITLPMGIRAYTLPDNAGTVYGFKYGPVVLAAELGRDDKMDTYQVGVQCDVCKTKIVNGEERTSTNGYGSTSNQGTLNSETLNVQNGVSVSEFIENIEDYLVKDGESLSFTLQGTDWGGSEPLKFTSYYKITDQRYGIYWLFAGEDPVEIQKRLLESKKNGRDANVYLDGVGIGYGTQTEGDDNNYPHIKNEGTGSTGDMGNLTRYAHVGGSFSYLFKVNKSKTNYLVCQYSKEDNGKTMVIKVGDIVIAEDKLNYEGTEEKYKVKYEIPAAAVAQAIEYEKTDDTTGKTEVRDVIRISFSGASGEESPKLWESAYTSTNYDNNAGIEKFTSDVGTVEKGEDNNYRLEVPADTKQVQLKIDLANKFGLLYMDNILTDDSKNKKIALKEKETVISIRVFAEDHQTKEDYQLTIAKKDSGSEGDIKVTDLTLNATQKTLTVEETFQLDCTVEPSNASNKEVSWKSSDDKIATVSENGLVTAIAKGTAIITVTSAENEEIKKECTITVKAKAGAEVIEPEIKDDGKGNYEVTIPEITPGEDTAIAIPLPGSLADSIKNSQSDQVSLNVKLPENLPNEKVEAINMPKEILEAAKEKGKDLSVAVNGSTSYQWEFSGSELSSAELTDINLSMQQTTADKDEEIKPLLNPEEEAVILAFAQQGKLPGAKVTVDVSSMGFKAGDVVTVSYYNAESGKIEDQDLTCTIDENGKVTIAIAKGGKYVLRKKVSDAVESVKLNKTSLSLNVGKSETLTATVLPENAKNKDVKWESSDDRIATVTEEGKVIARAKGTATITVSSADNETIKDTCKVTVKVPVDKVQLSKTKLVLAPQKTYTLIATSLPASANNKNVKWSSSDEKIASVSQTGKVTAKKVGTAVITVASVDSGVKATCKVTVKIPVTKVKLNKKKLTLGLKEKITLKATVSPSKATNKKVTWKSSKSSVVSVKNGKLTAKKKGKAVIKATADGKTAKCTVTVKAAPKKITLNAKKKTLKKGKTFQLKAKLTKNTASNKITYKSSNKKVAKVSATGKIKALKKGRATITATTFNKKKAKIKITVK